jgi:cytochrome c-type biogenesis protein CcmH
MFVSISLMLCMLAMGFVLWPLVNKRSKQISSGAVVEHDAVIRALYRGRVEEVATETADSDLLGELHNELSAVLLVEQTTQKSPTATTRGHPRWLVGLSLFVPVLAVLLYFQISDPSLPALRGAESVLTASEEDVAELESWRLRLAARVKDSPEDNNSWYLLGHSYLKLGRFAEAAEAFATTNKLAGDDLNVMLYWLQARYLNSRGMFDGVSHELADKLLAEHPDFPVVLEMLALDAFRREAYGESVRYLNRALSSTSDLTQQATFATAISQVRSNMIAPPPGVTVDVSVGSKIPGQATVFVIARPVGGGMPFAVVRRSAGAVPFTVRLDDLVSMSETRLLSSAEVFEVVVRLSQSGTARADEGDWQWRSNEIILTDAEMPVVEARLTPP